MSEIDEIAAAYDAIFLFVPETCDEEGKMLTVAEKIEIMADELRATKSALRKLLDAAVVVDSQIDPAGTKAKHSHEAELYDDQVQPLRAAIAEAERLLGKDGE